MTNLMEFFAITGIGLWCWWAVKMARGLHGIITRRKAKGLAHGPRKGLRWSR